MTETDNFRFVGVRDGFEALEVGTVDAFADSEVSTVGLGGRLTSTTISEVVFAGGELCIGL